jgi:hypothetical protein
MNIWVSRALSCEMPMMVMFALRLAWYMRS